MRLSALTRSSPLWGQVGQKCRRVSTSASEATLPKISGGDSIWHTFVNGIKDKGPGIFLGTIATGTVGTVGYFCNREFSRIDSTVLDLAQQIQQTNVRIDDTARTINARIDGLAKQMGEESRVLNTRIADETRAINVRIDHLGTRIDHFGDKLDQLKDKFDQLRDVIIQQQKKSSWW